MTSFIGLTRTAVLVCSLPLLIMACDGGDSTPLSTGPANAGSPPTQQTGNADAGKAVFRFETFGNERFWTDALRLPAGVVAAGITPVQALQLGLSVDVDQLDPATKAAIAAELQADPTGASGPLLNNPATTVALLNANAVIGLVVKDTDANGTLSVASGDKVGASCALCHTRTDGAVLKLANGGSIGSRIDGTASHNLDFGTLLAAGQNSRAAYPVLQLALTANQGATLGRAPFGLTENSTEAQVDAYLTNKDYYPVGMFDDSPDGNGDPMHNMPLFEQDLAFPYGSEGGIAAQDNFANLVYTALLDPTNLTTPGGRAFLRKLGGTAAGNEIVDDYIQVLAATGVTGYPYVQAAAPANAADAGTESFPLGVRVDNTKLADLNAYLFALPAPAPPATDSSKVKVGEGLFRRNCTGCHKSDQTQPVPTFIVAMKTIFPGDTPVVLLPMRDPPLNPILDTPAVTFDDKMAVVNASQRGLERGVALPLLLDLANKPVFLHDNSVSSLEELLSPSRSSTAPHPFAVADSGDRAAVIEFLRSK